MTTPIVSIVIATRNRAEKLARLLSHIRQQDFDDFQCVVVDDASSGATQQQYDDIWRELDHRFMLKRRENTGGPAQSRNTGISSSTGRYIAFCDDDDYWTRRDHLTVAVRTLQATGADFYFSNMQTSIDGKVANADWYAVLTSRVRAPIAGETDVYTVQTPALAAFLRHRIFHANTMVVSRELLDRINMYWEKVSFAEDHDLSFRLADAAEKILFRSTVTADLDVSPHPSIARTYSEQERILFGILATIHAEAAIKNPLLRKVVRGNRSWRFLELAQLKAQSGKTATAIEFTIQSLLLSPSLASLLMLMKLFWRQMIR